EFDQAKRQAVALKQAYIANRDGLQVMRQSLTAAGVDTRKLREAQKRLQQSTKQTQDILAAKAKLGIKPYQDQRAEIGRLRAAYDTLKKSGTLSTSELIRAKQQLRIKTAELRGETSKWSAALSKAHAGMLALASVGYAFVRSFQNYAQFEQRMGEVNTMLDVSKERFASLKDEIRGLTREIPQTASELAAAQYDILSAGVALEDSVRVLELSAKAAVAGVTDTKTAALTGTGVINAYGMSIDQLGGVYDILFQTVKSGVTTFPQLAQGIGNVLPTARSAGVEFKDVAAAIAAMTKSGIRTPQAMTALKGAINALAAPAPEAKKQFEALGITWQGLIPTLEQIRKKGLSIDQLRLLIPDVEARTGVQALTQNFESLQAILGKMDIAGGAMQDAYDKMKDTPENQVKLLKNAFDEVLLSSGALIAQGFIPLAKAIRWVMDGMREMDKPTKIAIATMLTAGVAFKLWKMGLGDMVVGMVGAVKQMGLTGAAATAMSSAWQAAGIGMKLAFAGVVAFTAIQLARLGTAMYQAYKAGKEAEASAERAAAANDKAVNSLARWKDVKVPDDIAGRAPEELEKLKWELFRAKLYYQQLIAQMERTGDKKGLEEAKTRLSEIRKGLAEIGTAATTATADMEKPTEAILASKEALDEFETKAKAAYEKAMSEAKKYAGQIDDINRRIADRQLDTEDKIRELKRQNLSEEEQAADIRLQAIEKVAAANEALARYQAD
ncbi:MAG: phage tail tape measure protein, partial [Desulfobacteraceae bacterium]|nr:phage tail tape measure protein [Desulfobacteraceae bacterium]